MTLHLTQCANHHKRTTRDIDSPCPECGAAIVNAYAFPTLLSDADGTEFDLAPPGDYLVTRLYNALANAELCHEAAREITRLRIALWKVLP